MREGDDNCYPLFLSIQYKKGTYVCEHMDICVKASDLILLLFGCVLMTGCKPEFQEIREFSEEGKLYRTFSLNIDSVLHGTLTTYYEDGQTVFEKAEYVDGMLQGERRLFYENGQVEIVEQYYNDRLEDTLRVYYESGNIKREVPYEYGVLTGRLKVYYERGGLKEEVTFSNNMENGPFTEYHENGQVKWTGDYLNGPNEFGTLTEYDSLGQMIRKMDCDSLSVCRTVWSVEEK